MHMIKYIYLVIGFGHSDIYKLWDPTSYVVIDLLLISSVFAMMKYPFSTESRGNGARHDFMCCFRLGMFGCMLRHRWHRSSSLSKLFSSPHGLTLPVFFSSSITPLESRKNAVVKEFQCFLFFMQGESKSWLTICMWSCLIDGSCRSCIFIFIKHFSPCVKGMYKWYNTEIKKV